MDTSSSIGHRFNVQIPRRKFVEISSILPSWHSDVATTLSQRRCWRCHNVVARSNRRVVPTSVSDVVITLLSDVVMTLSQRCYNVTTTLSIGFIGHFTTHYSVFFLFIEMWESYKSANCYYNTLCFSLKKRCIYS